MVTAGRILPQLTVNRAFMMEFVAAQAPALGLGAIKEGSRQCALLALLPERPIPPDVTAAGFDFGHSVLGGDDWEVMHFAFNFYGFAIYNVLVNPNNPVARSVLANMVETGGYFIFALDPNNQVTAFRSELGRGTIEGLMSNLPRIMASRTTDAQYQAAVAQFERRPDPPGAMLNWVCSGDPEYLNVDADPLVLNPAKG